MMLPHSIEAEQSVIGSLLLESQLISETADMVIEEDFYRNNHKVIFKVLKELGDTADLVTVSDKLNRISQETNWLVYLTEMASLVPTTANLKYYIRILKEKAAERKLLTIAENLKSENGDLSEKIQQAIKDIQALQIEDVSENGFVPELLGGILEEIESNNRKGELSGISTGFSKLNEFTGGWQPGRYYILGARPKMGKTSLFCQIADFASENIPVVIFSLEMTRKELIKLLIYQNSKIDSTLESSGKLYPKDFEVLSLSCRELYDRLLFIDDRSRTVPQILASLKRIQKDFDKRNKGRIGLVVIDYVQLINGNPKLSRNYQLEEISRSLKELAKDYNLTVLALSQLSREVESRKDCRPLPSDLKDSGSFEQDCDGLMLMYRDAYYNKRVYSGEKANAKVYKYFNADVSADIVDINFFLNRHGPTGILKLDFLPSFRKFIDPEDESQAI